MQDRDAAFESRVLGKLGSLQGRTIAELAQSIDMPPSGSKSYHASVIRALLASFNREKTIAQFDRRGIDPKVIRKPRDGRPYESMSFPPFKPDDLIGEAWETSTLRLQLHRLLFVLLYAPTADTPLPAVTLGPAEFWSPSEADAPRIHAEWEMFRKKIADGEVLDLPGEADTYALHVRTHGKDSGDLDPAPGIGKAPKRGFWLNRDFVMRAFREASRLRQAQGGD